MEKLGSSLNGHWKEVLLSTSHAMVTVSEYWADVLSKKFGKTVHVTRNGFDPNDFIPLKHEPDTSDDLNIAFPGTYYEKFHDIEPLVIAIKQLSEQNY